MSLDINAGVCRLDDGRTGVALVTPARQRPQHILPGLTGEFPAPQHLRHPMSADDARAVAAALWALADEVQPPADVDPEHAPSYSAGVRRGVLMARGALALALHGMATVRGGEAALAEAAEEADRAATLAAQAQGLDEAARHIVAVDVDALAHAAADLAKAVQVSATEQTAWRAARLLAMLNADVVPAEAGT